MDTFALETSPYECVFGMFCNASVGFWRLRTGLRPVLPERRRLRRSGPSSPPPRSSSPAHSRHYVVPWRSWPHLSAPQRHPLIPKNSTAGDSRGRPRRVEHMIFSIRCDFLLLFLVLSPRLCGNRSYSSYRIALSLQLVGSLSPLDDFWYAICSQTAISRHYVALARSRGLEPGCSVLSGTVDNRAAKWSAIHVLMVH